jgi:hypothetical protein
LLKIDDFCAHAFVNQTRQYRLKAKKLGENSKLNGKRYGPLQHCAAIFAVGLLPACATLSKVTKRKTNGNAQTLKRGDGFRISRKPMLRPAVDERLHDVGDNVGLRREYGARILFAIARDSRTIFASWNIDWPSLFEKVVPVDRQVHLRVYSADGLEEKTVAVEPMAAMHYVTTSGPYASYRVEIGYYQPADVWHSVAISHEIVMPPDGIAETADVDLATIPFHVGFQQLLNLFGPPTDTGLATVLSRFQKRVLSEEPKRASAEEQETLHKINLSLPEIAAAWRAFNEADTEKLTRRTATLLESGSTSPSRRLEGEWASAGS